MAASVDGRAVEGEDHRPDSALADFPDRAPESRRWCFADQLGPHFIDAPQQQVLLIESKAVSATAGRPRGQDPCGGVTRAPQ